MTGVGGTPRDLAGILKDFGQRIVSLERRGRSRGGGDSGAAQLARLPYAFAAGTFTTVASIPGTSYIDRVVNYPAGLFTKIPIPTFTTSSVRLIPAVQVDDTMSSVTVRIYNHLPETVPAGETIYWHAVQMTGIIGG